MIDTTYIFSVMFLASSTASLLLILMWVMKKLYENYLFVMGMLALSMTMLWISDDLKNPEDIYQDIKNGSSVEEYYEWEEVK